MYREIIQHVCVLGFCEPFESVCSGGFNTCQFFLIYERILLRVRKTAVAMKYSIAKSKKKKKKKAFFVGGHPFPLFKMEHFPGVNFKI